MCARDRPETPQASRPRDVWETESVAHAEDPVCPYSPKPAGAELKEGREKAQKNSPSYKKKSYKLNLCYTT
jgi:hypothetical protein